MTDEQRQQKQRAADAMFNNKVRGAAFIQARVVAMLHEAAVVAVEYGISAGRFAKMAFAAHKEMATLMEQIKREVAETAKNATPPKEPTP